MEPPGAWDLARDIADSETFHPSGAAWCLKHFWGQMDPHRLPSCYDYLQIRERVDQ